jgi:hypothetical protein
MRTISIGTIVSMLALLNIHVTNAQSTCDALKKENEYLKKTLQINTPTKTVSAVSIDFNVIKVEGNTKDQTVTLVMTFVNHNANEEIQYYEAKAIDIEGNEYKDSNRSIGNEQSRNTLYTDTPIKSTITFSKVLPSVKMLKLVPIHFLYNKPLDVKIEFKDLPITWK